MTRRGSISLVGVHKTYGPFTAIRDLNLTVEPGKFFAFVGPSGSGKTTSLRVIAGLEPVDRGRVLIDDGDVTLAPPGDRDTAMVFQNYALYPHMTVAQNIASPLKMVKTPRDEIAVRVSRAAERVQMAHLLDRRPGQLSGGQQQRVALARAIVHDLPARRTLVQPGRAAAPGDPGGAQEAAARPWCDRGVRDARPGRGVHAR